MHISSLSCKIELMSIINQRFPPNLKTIYNESFSNQLAKTQAAVVSLNQSKRLLHNPTLLMKPILVKEAEASSRLEGTQASIEDVYKIDIVDQSDDKRQDILEIRNYEKAMLEGINLINKTGKLNNFVIRNIHKTLLRGVRGKDKLPGNFREEPVWIGQKGTGKDEARYIPPEHIHVPTLMEELEKYILESKKSDVNPLIACGVIHHRFEAIHPFKDGNGRTGRLLISLYLIYREILSEPMLYASGYFERQRIQYMDALAEVDNNENWQNWLTYFIEGIEIQANRSMKMVLNINGIYKSAEEKIKGLRSYVALLQALEYCFVRPVITARILSENTGIPLASSKRYLEKLSEHGIIKDSGLIRRQRVYLNAELLKILQKV